MWYLHDLNIVVDFFPTRKSMFCTFNLNFKKNFGNYLEVFLTDIQVYGRSKNCFSVTLNLEYSN